MDNRPRHFELTRYGETPHGMLGFHLNFTRMRGDVTCRVCLRYLERERSARSSTLPLAPRVAAALAVCANRQPRASTAAGKVTIRATDADRLAIYAEVAAKLRATGERGSEVAALLVEQLADELAEAADRG